MVDDLRHVHPAMRTLGDGVLDVFGAIGTGLHADIRYEGSGGRRSIIDTVHFSIAAMQEELNWTVATVG